MASKIQFSSCRKWRVVRHQHIFRGVRVGAIRDKGYLVMVQADAGSGWFPIHVIRKLK